MNPFDHWAVGDGYNSLYITILYTPSELGWRLLSLAGFVSYRGMFGLTEYLGASSDDLKSLNIPNLKHLETMAVIPANDSRTIIVATSASAILYLVLLPISLEYLRVRSQFKPKLLTPGLHSRGNMAILYTDLSTTRYGLLQIEHMCDSRRVIHNWSFESSGFDRHHRLMHWKGSSHSVSS